MSIPDPVEVVLRFNACINAGDLDGLGLLMTGDHCFIDKEHNELAGKWRCLQAWGEFFKLFPGYRNTFQTVSAHAGMVIIQGFSTCADSRLQGPAIWTAKVQGDKIAEWHVYHDSDEVRQLLTRSQSIYIPPP